MRVALGVGLAQQIFRRGVAGGALGPVLSAASASPYGFDGSTGSVTTDKNTGTLYSFYSTSATPPTAANLKAGTGATALKTQAIGSTGAKTVQQVGGLAANTAYYRHDLHNNGTDSNILTSGPFTTYALKVVAEGDSITAFTSPNSYANLWIAANPGITAVNSAVGGATLGFPADRTLGAGGSNGGNNVWARIDADLALLPSIFTLGIGANDGYGTDAATYYARIIELVNYVKAQRPGIKVCLLSNYPVYVPGNTSLTTAYNDRQRGIATLMRAGVGTDFEAFGDIRNHPYLVDAIAASTPTDYDGAGVHPLGPPHARGYAVYEAMIRPVINGATATTPSAFAFNDDPSSALSSTITGTEILVTGMRPTQSVAVTVTGHATAVASVGQGAFSTSPGNVMNGDAITPRVTSAGTNSTARDAIVTAGSTADTFTSTTVPAAPLGLTPVTSSVSVTGSGTAVTGGVEHTLPSFTMPATGRLVIGIQRPGVVATALSAARIERVSDNAVLATGTVIPDNLGSTPRYVVAFDNAIASGEVVRLVAKGASAGSVTVVAWPAVLTNSLSTTYSDSDRGGASSGTAVGAVGTNALKMVNSVTVPTGGLGVLWVFCNATINSWNSNTLVHAYGDGWHWATFSVTSDGAINNAAASAAGMIGVSFS